MTEKPLVVVLDLHSKMLAYNTAGKLSCFIPVERFLTFSANSKGSSMSETLSDPLPK